MKDNEKFFARKEEILNKKVAALLKEVAQLSRGVKKSGTGGGSKNGDGGGSEVNSNDGGGVDSGSGKESGGSGTDSPNTN